MGAELWPLPTGRTVNQLLDVFLACLHSATPWTALTVQVDEANDVEEVNSVTAASILLDRIDREIGAAQRYAARLEGYEARGVVPAGFSSHADVAEEIRSNRAEEQRLRDLAGEVDTWTRSRAPRTAKASAAIDQAIAACDHADWRRGQQPAIPAWWPRGALRPSDCKLHTPDEWSALAVALMRRAVEQGVTTAVDATALREQLTTKRGASLHSSWL